MKRILSAILSLLLVLAAFAPCYTVISNYIERNNVSRFCSAVSQLNKKYKSVESQILYDENGDKNLNSTQNRLIIKTKDKIKNTKAIDEVYGLDYAVLQYENKGDMLEDYDNLQSRGYSVEKDRIYFLNDFDDVKTKENITVLASSSSSNYGYVNSGADYAKEVFQHNIESYDEIVVGIMDSGIDYTHEIFENRYVENRINFSSEGDADDPMDKNLHGTAVASIVVQSTPDNVKVKPYKIIGANGAAMGTEIISALEYVLAEKDKPDVMNMSFGGYIFDGSDKIMNDLVEELVECGISVCVAAGNESVPAEYSHPANCPSVITVSSHGSTSYISDYSDYGKAVDVSAPGEKIYTAKLGGGYTSEYSGTSFSAPFVSAACACILMQNPDMTPAQVKEKIKSSAVGVGDDDSYYFGSGMLSFINLINDKSYDIPVPNVSGGLYHDEQIVSFDIPDGVELAYTTDRSIPSELSSKTTIYTEPITMSSDTLLIYALVKDGAYVSNITSQEYIIQYYADESDFTVDSGVITACNTSKKNIIVPDTIDGIAPIAVASGTFKKSRLQSIVLPDSVTTLEGGCFKDCTGLKHIVAKGVTEFSGDSVFSGCTDLRDEVMPNLKTVTESAFANCTKLHEIDFGENITSLKSNLFADSGLLYGDFPNANATESDEAIFKNCTLFICNIPKLNTLYKNMFYGCSYLYDLKTDTINTIHSEAIKYCNYLDFDTTHINTLYVNALSGCRIDTVYAPEVTEITTYSRLGSPSIGEYCNIRVLDLPSLTTPLKSKSISYSSIQELYLDSVTQMTMSGALHNMPFLNIVYMPNVQQFYTPTASLSTVESFMREIFGIYLQKPPLEIVWIPKAEIKSKTVTLTDTKLLFAPSTSSLTVKMANDDTQASIVVSEKITDGQLTIANSGKAPVVIAPKGSYAQQYASDENCGYTFVSADDCIYNGTDEKSNMLYTAGENNFSVPLDFVTPCWDTDSVNKTRTESFYEFLLDFTNDNFINAKDFSVLQKNQKAAG